MSIKKHIPNTITCCNLISGCIATYWALCGVWDTALLFIIIGAVFDFFDGMSARLLGVSSPIGKELDSLADDITFGFAPSAIIFDFLKSGMEHLPWHYLAYAAFIMAAFSALRLAKFNLDERQAMACQRPLLGCFAGRSRRLACLLTLFILCRICRYVHQLLPLDCRDSHVCLEVQALGMERERDQIYLPADLYTLARLPGSQWTGSHHRMVYSSFDSDIQAY